MSREVKEVTIDKEHHQSLKVESAKTGKSMKEIVEEWIEQNTDH